MKKIISLNIVFILLLTQCTTEEKSLTDYSSSFQVEKANPVSVILTTYSTTLIADGKDETNLRITIADSISREISSANDSIFIYLSGDGKVLTKDGKDLPSGTDTAGNSYRISRLENGVSDLLFRAGTSPGKVSVEARRGRLWPGSHEIHTVPSDFVYKKPEKKQLVKTERKIDRMIGADISFLPQFEDRGLKFLENGTERDAIELLRDHGFNYIRLRIFVNPENERGYSPGEGYCGLAKSLEMAKRIKAAGMKLLLNFHYSDYWADPQQQNKPEAWSELDFPTLKDSVRTYTTRVINAFKSQGTMPEMVQVGNEINHGILWPDGHISNPDQLAELLIAGTEGVRIESKDIPVMMHIALGGQNDESVFWLDNMIARDVSFDIIGISYYPRWHGTLNDLQYNLSYLVKRYGKPVNVVEYSNFKKEVHDIVFNLADNMGKGACIWEPLGWRSEMFDRSGETTDIIHVYDELAAEYLGDDR